MRCRWISAGVALVATIACHNPANPGDCDPVTHTDGLGRGPVVSYWVTCNPQGSNVLCTSERRESSYCASSQRPDVTAQTMWSSSDPSILIATQPGTFTAVGSGPVEIVAKVNGSIASPEIAYAIAPGATPERLSRLSVWAEDASNGTRIPDVVVEFTPEGRGGRQTGLTAGQGGSVTFWVFWPNAITVSGAKDGWMSAQAVAGPQFGSDTQYLLAVLRMQRK